MNAFPGIKEAGTRENSIKNPNMAFEVRRAIAEGPFVAVHARVRMANELGMF